MHRGLYNNGGSVMSDPAELAQRRLLDNKWVVSLRVCQL